MCTAGVLQLFTLGVSLFLQDPGTLAVCGASCVQMLRVPGFDLSALSFFGHYPRAICLWHRKSQQT